MIGACIFMAANETRGLIGMGSPIKKIAKFILHSKCFDLVLIDTAIFIFQLFACWVFFFDLKLWSNKRSCT